MGYKKISNSIVRYFDEGEKTDISEVIDFFTKLGVPICNINGNFRNLEDVLIDLSKKWEGLINK